MQGEMPESAVLGGQTTSRAERTLKALRMASLLIIVASDDDGEGLGLVLGRNSFFRLSIVARGFAR